MPSTCVFGLQPPVIQPRGLIAAIPATPHPREYAAMADVRWRTGQTIQVSFMQRAAEPMDFRVRAALSQAAEDWTKSANLVFKFTEQSASADVDVNTSDRLAPYGTYSSFLGQQNAAAAAAGQPSMHLVFDPDDADNTDLELLRVCRHELGHVLGFIHEHERPDRALIWNEPAVYKYYSRLTGGAWSWDEIRAQVIEPYDQEIIAETLWDPQSIMMYPVPPGLAVTLEGEPFSVGWNETLSDRDRLAAARLYPYPPAKVS